MLKKSIRSLCLTALVVGGFQLSTLNVATATILPSALTPALQEITGKSALVQKTHRRSYRHTHRRRYSPRRRYDRRRYGTRYRSRRPRYDHYYRGWWYDTPWWAAPLVIPRATNNRAHRRWCGNRYRSYNPRTDSFLGYDGIYYRCRSPYRR